ncbi:MAG: DUF922 domain-containing protein [Ferruginibacter sp.]
MKKYCLLFLLLVFSKFSIGQQVIISGAAKNRLLTWNDFSGKPDKKSEHEANTFWKINYSYTGVNFQGDSAKLKGLSVKLELDADQSWIKSGKETANLLKHEQGHFDVGLICLKEMIEKLNNSVFHKQDISAKVQNLFSEVLNKYLLMNKQYDKETDHSKKKEEQEKWDQFFAKELNR